MSRRSIITAVGLLVALFTCIGAQRGGAEPGCVDPELIIGCTGYDDCTISSAQSCAGNPSHGYLCAPDLVAFYNTFCEGMYLYSADCASALAHAQNNGKICCVDACSECTAQTNCSTP